MSSNELSKAELGLGKVKIGAGSISSPDSEIVKVAQKLLAELIGTYILIFSGCGSVVVNKLYDGVVSFPGICIVWGLTVMVMIYSVGHISGAHFNPAVTMTLAIFQRFPWKEVPLYIITHLIGSLLASVTLRFMFPVNTKIYFGTVPAGSDVQSFVIEIIISAILMFVVSGVATEDRANAQFAGVAVGMTVVLNVFVAGPVSGASMNPARSLGPAIVMNIYKGLWVYMVGPLVGTICGAFAYNLMRTNNS